MSYKGLGNGYRLLLELYAAGGKLQGGQLRAAITNYDTAKNIARELQSMGLIEVEIIQRPKSIHWYSLTDKGRKVAEKLAEAEKIVLGGTPRP
jgi:DNA-binding MarR family transcriptional regulator